MIKGVVLLENHNNMLDGCRGGRGRLRRNGGDNGCCDQQAGNSVKALRHFYDSLLTTGRWKETEYPRAVTEK
jgi:hypothetical protein